MYNIIYYVFSLLSVGWAGWYRRVKSEGAGVGGGEPRGLVEADAVVGPGEGAIEATTWKWK
jgi:hypothetical protein